MSRTINTTINGPLFLLPTDNPLTITASGGVNATATDAIDGDSSTAWAISNAGTVSSASGLRCFCATGRMSAVSASLSRMQPRSACGKIVNNVSRISGTIA